MTFAGQDGARLGGEVFHAKHRSPNPPGVVARPVAVLRWCGERLSRCVQNPAGQDGRADLPKAFSVRRSNCASIGHSGGAGVLHHGAPQR